MTDQELVRQLTPSIEMVMWAGFGSGIAAVFLVAYILGLFRPLVVRLVRLARLRRVRVRRVRLNSRYGG